ncbi:MAG: Recombination protein RecR [Thermodesulfobacterium commune]|uniref:Recombination protein RecR n=1 Tax=Thermodesulfobacterium commune TaxID=1741 RepID=A0A101FJ70_9BACT|nr:MAG: Recombination protein RecR [Thermodesulfobacterium commune]HAA84106.1 recombination protein RecR [Thermodesulfobacterium commune]
MSVGYPLTLRKVIESLSKIPGIGEKSATRIALFLLSKPEFCETLGDLIKELPYKVRLCKFCRNLSEEEICKICNDDTREAKSLCIVENPVNLFHIENTGIYKGYYFVLHYLLSPKDGIGPKEIEMDKLLSLIRKRRVEEVIFALSPTLGGEATISYILQVLKDYPIKVSRLACGVPMGMDLQFVDPLTLKRALLSRELLKEQ